MFARLDRRHQIADFEIQFRGSALNCSGEEDDFALLPVKVWNQNPASVSDIRCSGMEPMLRD
jgi:hypothetical protein